MFNITNSSNNCNIAGGSPKGGDTGGGSLQGGPAGGVPFGGGPAGLGNYTEFASKEISKALLSPPLGEAFTRKELRYKRQVTASRLLPGHRINVCHKKVVNANGVGVHWHEGKAYYSNLMACGSLWVCPVCAAKINVGRREELKRALVNYQESRIFGDVRMVTFTMRHHLGDALADRVQELKEAIRIFRSGRAYKEIKEVFGIEGTITVTEVTYGKNGWHPHLHVIMFFAEKQSVKELQFVFGGRWRRCLQAMGVDGLEDIACRVSEDEGDVSAYVTKFGLAWEFTSPGSKVSKGVKPFEMLDWAAKGDLDAIRLFQEYASAMKGKAMLVWSKGLKKMLLVPEVSDTELAEKEETEGKTLLVLRGDEWQRVIDLGLRGTLLDIAEMGDDVKLFEWCMKVGIIKMVGERYL